MKKKIFLIMSLVALVSCTNVSTIKDKIQSKREIIKQEFEVFNKNSLVGREFLLQNEAYKNKGIFIGFTKDRIYGSGGINRFFANYKIVNDKLIVDTMGSTKMAGRKEDMVQEFTFLSIFREENEIKLEDYKLILKSKQGIELEFRDRNYKEEIPAQKINKKTGKK